MADEPDEENVDSTGETGQEPPADAEESTARSSEDADREETSASGGLDVTVNDDLEDGDGEDDTDGETEDVDGEPEEESDADTTTDDTDGETEDVDGEPEEESDADTTTDDDADGADEAATSADDEAGDGSEDEAGDGSEDETDDEPPGIAKRREAKADGEGAVGELPDYEKEETSYPDPDDDDIGGIDAPPDDEEMPLADHIEEMIMRLAVVLLFGSAATAIGLLWASPAIEFIWLEVFPAAAEEVPPPHVYHPLELWLTRIKVAALLGIMVALPAFVYQCYLFMRPGLYPHERKYYLAAVPTSVVLAGVGMLFSFFVVLPILFEYFTFYAEGSADIAYALGETFNLIITLTGFLAIVFQIPLFIMLAIMMGVTTRRWLAEKRLYFWAAFAGLSFMFTVDPTMMAPVIVAIVMILLFEGTLLVLKWVGKE